MAMHFIGFKIGAMAAGATKDARWINAVRVFGQPDFVHYRFDARARQEIAPGDVAVFAVGSDADAPAVNAYDDSAVAEADAEAADAQPEDS